MRSLVRVQYRPQTRMELKIIYQDQDLLVIDKPPRLTVFHENKPKKPEKTLIDYLLDKYPSLSDAGKVPRYGLVHRIDKDTSGLLLIAKNNRALSFFQEQFLKREVEKKYLALAHGLIKQDEGIIQTLIGRAGKDRRKQRAFTNSSGQKKEREAVTRYKSLKRFDGYTLLEVEIKTGRKHQIRAHFAFLQHPLVGDKLYCFKNQKEIPGLERQFLHASYLKIKLPFGETKKFTSPLPNDLKLVIYGLTVK